MHATAGERQRRRPELTRRRRGRAVARGRPGHRAAATRTARHRRHLAGRAGERVRGVSHRKRAGRVGDATADRRRRLPRRRRRGAQRRLRRRSMQLPRPPLPGDGDHRVLAAPARGRPGSAALRHHHRVGSAGERRRRVRRGSRRLRRRHAGLRAGRPRGARQCGATPAPGPSPPASPVPGAGATPPPPTTGPTPASPASPAPATPGAPATPPATAPRRTATRCRVPNLRGRTVAAARRALRARNCRLGAVTRVRARGVARGRVLSHRPRAGRVLPAGTRVHVRVRR